ncbi:hypothetical protein T4B_13805 [Trichinella pseudospiralis]|uniref:Uncharacterized protein n=1 Tax=Trichinella pseudospiralis TaxID=6337 RepID=A0A0V1IGA9_TRIPS|nr:hypothetical protein T4B_13805 [Trichinella pseudospiralis]
MFNTYQVKCKSAGVKIIISTTKLLKYEKFYKQKKVGGGGCPRKWMSQKNFKKIKIKYTRRVFLKKLEDAQVNFDSSPSPWADAVFSPKFPLLIRQIRTQLFTMKPKKWNNDKPGSLKNKKKL